MSVSNPVRPARAKTVAARSTPIHIRVKKQQKELIDAACSLVGKNRSDFMLETACREAEAVILDQRVFHADSDQYRRRGHRRTQADQCHRLPFCR